MEAEDDSARNGARDCALLVFAPSFTQSGSAHRSVNRLVGEWRMTSLEVGTEGNLRPVQYSGRIIFTRSGTVSVQAMNLDPDAPDTRYTTNGYEAFYGSVSVDRASGTFDVTSSHPWCVTSSGND